MPHHRPLLRAHHVAAMLFALVACSPPGTLTVVADASDGMQPLEVFAIPVDPLLVVTDAHAGAPAAEPGTPRGDSVARALALLDSARISDEMFQRERTALNEEAQQLASLDRRSAEYGRRHDAHRARLAGAERLRSTRDRQRELASALQARTGASGPSADPTIDEGEHAARRKAYEDARDGSRRARVVDARAGGATIRLEPGTWWIGVAWSGVRPIAFAQVTVRAGRQDTVRFGAR